MAELDHAQQINHPLALMLLDLDHFKSVNDAFGHQRGDLVLQEFVRRARAAIRPHDLIFRYGGDEFVLLVPGAARARADQIAQRIVDDIAGRPFGVDPPLTLTVSVGVAIFPDDGHDPETLFARADRRSFEVKRIGRSQAISSDTSLDLPIDPPSRLIDRDAAMAQVQRFLDLLPTQPWSLLQIKGVPGSGQSRMLDEAIQAAELRGIPVIPIRGSPAIAMRVYGALNEVVGWPDLPPPAMATPQYAHELARLIQQRNAHTCLIAIDHVDQIDHATFSRIRSLLTIQLPISCGLVVGDPGWPVERYLPTDPPTTITPHVLHLTPISEDGLRAWLRQSLHWEPPAPFLRWFAELTGGLPAQIERALMRLITNRGLQREETGWSYHPAITTVMQPSLLLPPPNAMYGFPSMGDLVGRVAELRQLAELLRTHQVVLVSGPGGIGKTHVALQVGAEQARHFAGGVWWVPLSQITSSRQIVPAIASALHLEVAGGEDPFERLVRTLRVKPTLLILDGLQSNHLDLQRLEQLLERAPAVHVLITAQTQPPFQQLAKAGQVALLPMTGLAVPVGDHSDAIEHADAVQLFLVRAQQIDPTLRIDPPSHPAIAQICRLMAGIPLGIEYAAAQVAHTSCEQIASDLAQDLMRSSTASGLTVAMDGLWRLLSPYEQASLCDLAILRGGFTAEAAAQIATASPFFLRALVANGYLRRQRDGRYELAEPLRQYALEHLDHDSDRAYTTSLRHAHFFANLATQQTDRLFVTRAAHDLLRADFGNLRGAWEFAALHGLSSILADMCTPLLRYSMAAGLLTDYLDSIAEATEWLHRSIQVPTLAQLGDLALLYAQQASACYKLSRFEQAIATATTACAYARESNQTTAEVTALLALGDSLIVQTRSAMAYTYLREALDLAHISGLPWLEATTLISMAYAANGMRRYAEARESLSAALTLFRALGDRRSEATTLNALGNLCEDRGDPIAQQFYEEALAIYRALDDRDGECGVLHNLGVVAILIKQFPAARATLEQALRGFQELGSRFGEAISRYNLGRVARELAEWPTAEQQLNESLALTRTIGNRELEVSVLNALAATSLLQGHTPQARHSYASALKLARRLADKRGQSRVLAGVARAELASGRPLAALRAAKRSLAFATTIDHPLFQTEALTALAQTYTTLSNHAAAEQANTQARTILRELGLDG
ncbi:MAG: hypothetical protein Fur005_31940 [Roseiflexaceae bacterium]